jgi:phosphatidylglycerol lysyltransferase
LLLGLVLTALNYAVLTGHDFLAFAYIGKRPARRRIALASFLAYAIANNIGFAMLSGASVRYRRPSLGSPTRSPRPRRSSR